MKKGKRILSLAASLLCMLAVCMPVVCAKAATNVDLSKNGVLTLSYQYGGANLSNMKVHIYQVADISASCTFTLTPAFVDSKVKVQGVKTQDEWNAAAKTLAPYVVDKKLTTGGTATGANGSVTFSGLKLGLYLVVSDGMGIGSTTYTIDPFLISVPSLDKNGNWVYDLTSKPKAGIYTPGTTSTPTTSVPTTSIPDTPVPGGTAYQVVKRWDDSGYENKRPQSITVDLLKNGTVARMVTLNSANDWSYAWVDSVTTDVWTVVEKNVPSPYTVTTDASTTTLIVTNTYPTEIPNESVPQSDKPHLPNGYTEIPDMPPPKGGALPQTGQLWWPVPVLAVSGLLLASCGWFIIAKDRKKHE